MPLFTRPEIGPATTVLARCALPAARAVDIVAAIPLPQVFTGWGPFPPVTRVEGQAGEWDRVGRTRRPQLGDGGEVTETVVEYTPGVGFAYELIRFTDVFDRLVHGVRGEWVFTPDGDGCMIRWTWEFKARFGRRWLMAAVVGPLWQRYMRQMMATTVRLAEAAGATEPTSAA